MPSHGWLHRDDSLSWRICGYDIDPATRTRREEYSWVATRLMSEVPRDQAVTVLDVATGYVPGWHMMPYIAAVMGFDVTTIDHDPRTLDMPSTQNVKRHVADATAIPFDNESFDIVLCVSTLEHMQREECEKAVSEIVRVAKRRIIATADVGWWLRDLFVPTCDTGAELPWRTGQHLDPPVYAVDAIKL